MGSKKPFGWLLDEFWEGLGRIWMRLRRIWAFKIKAFASHGHFLNTLGVPCCLTLCYRNPRAASLRLAERHNQFFWNFGIFGSENFGPTLPPTEPERILPTADAGYEQRKEEKSTQREKYKNRYCISSEELAGIDEEETTSCIGYSAVCDLGSRSICST